MEPQGGQFTLCAFAISDRDYTCWQHPFAATRIRMHRAPLKRLSTEALRRLRGSRPSEIGGLLWGKILSEGEDSALILEAEMIPAQGLLYNNTETDSRTIEQALERRAGSGLQLLGYFRSHIRDGLCLSPCDQELIRRHFNKPEYMFLLIRPFEMGICMGAFFFWQNGALQWDGSDLEVPFVPLDAGSHSIDCIENTGGEEQSAGPEEQSFEIMPDAVVNSARETEPPAHPPPPVPSLPIERPRGADPYMPQTPIVPATPAAHFKSWVLMAGFFAVLLVATLAAGSAYFALPFLKSHLVTLTEPAAQAGVGLRVIRASDGQLDLIWDRNALERAGAQNAVLNIHDGSISKELTIDSAQLQTGALTYFPTSADVQFRLEVSFDRGRSAAESVRVLLPQSAKVAAAAASHPKAPVRVRPERAKALKEPPRRNEGIRLGFRPPAYVPPLEVFGSDSLKRQPAAPDLRLDASAAVYAAAVPSLAALFKPPALPLHPPVHLGSAEVPASKPAAPPHSAPLTDNARIYVPPRPIRRVMPDMTLAGRTLATQVTQVHVRVSIDANGRVKEAVPEPNGKDANGLVASAAVTAARQWVFQPAMLRGRPVPAEHLIVFDFRSKNQ